MIKDNLVLNITRCLTLASVASFILSLTQHGYYIAGDTEGADGIALLLIGWMGIFVGEYVWMANVFWLVAWILIFTSKSPTRFFGLSALPAIISAVGLTISLSFCFQRTTLCGSGPIGSESIITHYGLGYYFWVSSFILQLMTTLLAAIGLKSKVESQQQIAPEF